MINFNKNTSSKLVRLEEFFRGFFGILLILFLAFIALFVYLKCTNCNMWNFPLLTNKSSAPIVGSEAFPNNAASESGSASETSSIRSLLSSATVRIIAGDGAGSGFFISPNIIVTNRHVVEDAKPNLIYAVGGALGKEPQKVAVLALSHQSEIGKPDFAALKIEKSISGSIPLKITNIPKALDRVFSSGYPGQVIALDSDQIAPDPILTAGEVSVIQQASQGFELIVHSANIARGSSGGPLVDTCGRVVGVNTFIKQDKENIDGRVLFALPSSTLLAFLQANNIIYSFDSRPCSSS